MDWKKPEIEQFVAALLSLRSPEEMQRFLRDVLTEKEIKEFANRLKTARMLDNKEPYTTIQKATGFSSTTIARVSRWLQKGQGGYKMVLDRLHHSASTARGSGLR